MTIVHSHHPRAEEEGESAFASMTDLTVSFLFIILILLVFFAIQFNPEETKVQEGSDKLAIYLEDVSAVRTDLLKRMAEHIRGQIPYVRVTVSPADGLIRFRGDDLFGSGEWRILSGSTADLVSQAVSEFLADALRCYTVTVRGRPPVSVDCSGMTEPIIETIQIEGHTDDIPIGVSLQEREQILDNLDLSARRGAETLRATHRHRPSLEDFRNRDGQPVLSFAGYGAMRPIDQGNTAEARAANRRVDIRIILQTPQNLREVEEIRERLTRSRSNSPHVMDENMR